MLRDFLGFTDYLLQSNESCFCMKEFMEHRLNRSGYASYLRGQDRLITCCTFRGKNSEEEKTRNNHIIVISARLFIQSTRL